MAAPVTQTVSKSAKKKAAAKAAIERTDSPAPSAASGAADKAGEDGGFESPYIKELQKNIRNVNKKIANVAKTDSILAQNAGKSLDELVDAKVLNHDQRAQIVKKPGMLAQLAQYEEQLTQFRQLHEQYQAKSTADKADWDKSLEQVRTEAVAGAEAGWEEKTRSNLLVLSQFLRLAAYRREEGQAPESDESQAIEGVLLAIYTGDENAVASMLKLVNGSSDAILSVPGDKLETTYAKVKTLSQDYKTPLFTEPTEPAPSTEEAPLVGTDPTLAHASATELDAGDAAPMTNSSVEAATNGIANASISGDGANAVAESHWDATNEMSLSQEWVDVKVPRDPAETETGLQATPAAPTNTQSWADEQPDPVPETVAVPDPNDGFRQVQRKPRHESQASGNFRGRGRGGEYRGRGSFRGEGRGRGRGNRGGDRGGDRGGAGRGGRRNEES